MTCRYNTERQGSGDLSAMNHIINCKVSTRIKDLERRHIALSVVSVIANRPLYSTNLDYW